MASSNLEMVTQADLDVSEIEALTPADRLEAVLGAQLKHAADAIETGLQTYESLRNVSEVIGGEYGDRVLFELFQNAHDAHEQGNAGSILLKLVVHSEQSADLYVANTGRGFSWENVNAIRNVGMSSKSVGEGIGNKGLGFRSVETLTDDPRIYSQNEAVAAESFDGYCFRFADRAEIEREAARVASQDIAKKVAEVLPRYLAATPLHVQPDEIAEFAKEGFATVIHLPLREVDAVSVAQSQATALSKVEVPLLLFLDRLAKVVIEIHEGGKVKRKTLTRKVLERPEPTGISDIDYEIVAIEPGRRRYLVTRKAVERERLLEAVEASIAKERQLARWRDWEGQPKVALAIPLATTDGDVGRIYNFLPMAVDMPSPIGGHVDAPFYATIDRRRANFELPLNAFLLDELADLAVQSALEVKAIAQWIGKAVVFDLAAWNPDDLDRLERVCERRGLDWQDLEIVPEAGGAENWCTLPSAFVWEEKGYRLFRVRRLVKAGVTNLADPGLGERRLDRICSILEKVAVRALPDYSDLAEWIEAVASSLAADNSQPQTWGTFYGECRKALSNVRGLKELAGKKILRTRDGTVEAAMGLGNASPVFVREAVGHRRKSESAPLPPKSLASKFSILDDDIPLAHEVLADFIKAELLKPYDPVEVLASIPATFGDRPAPKRRQAALTWAFDVWRAEGSKCEKTLAGIDLHVETAGGWQPASVARFSEGWTPDGRKLTTYLAETASLSADCAKAAEMLLVSEPRWLPKSAPLKKQWLEFLKAAGVEDGLPLLSDEEAPDRGSPNYTWNRFLRTEEAGAGRSEAWVASNKKRHLYNPQTIYSRRGELWRFPGQIEHDTFPPEARVRLAELVMVQASKADAGWANWCLGRYERFGTDRNETQFLTPAAAFVATGHWLPVDGEDDRFERPERLWASTDGRRKPSRYVDRPKEKLLDIVEGNEKLASFLFSPTVGLRDWSAPDQASRKLADMAKRATNLLPVELVAFRKAYHQAWSEVCSSDVDLPSDLPLVVSKSAGPAVVNGNSEIKPRVFVSGGRIQPETGAVLAAGEAVLHLLEEELVDSAIAKLRASDGFDAVAVDPGQVGVLVDGNPMVVTTSDPLLASEGLEWLSEAAALANDILGQGLERQIHSSTVAERLGRVRLRRCGTIRLSVGGTAVDEVLDFYALPDKDNPTLVIGNDEVISWPVLADAAPALSTLLDRRMRSFETLLLRLAARRATDDPRQRPSDENFARALGCGVELVREHALALKSDLTVLLDRFVPILACLTDLATAEQLYQGLGQSPSNSEIIAALGTVSDRLPCEPEQLVEILGKPDLADVRRLLDIDFGDLNRMLAQLGRPVLSNEGELRRLFETWKRELAGFAVDRLRRHFWSSFRAGESLQRYVAMRELDFVEFRSDWIVDHEHLLKEDVRALIEERLEASLGQEQGREQNDDQALEPLDQVRRQSGRILRRFVEANARVVGAWCFANDVEDPWKEGALSVVKKAERSGLLDFEAIEEGREIAVLDRAELWPKGMPQSVEPTSLGLDPDDLDGATERERQRLEKREAEKRTIKFAGVPLDTRNQDFTKALVDLAQDQMSDGDWLTRSRRRISLKEQAMRSARTKSGKGAGGGPRQSARVSEEVRSAMGFASEYLASRFLSAKHGDRYHDRCWVSENRGLLEIDWDGDDSLGYDFLVRTAEVEWRYEVKSNLDDAYEFEFSQNEMRVAAECSNDATRKYRILYVPFVFDPSQWRVMQLPNPFSEKGKGLFREVGAGATRLKFDLT